MLSTNILPQKERQEIGVERVRRVILFLSAGFVFVLVVASVLLLPSYLPILFERQELLRTRTQEQKSLDALGADPVFSKARAVETRIQTLLSVQKSTRRVSDTFVAMRNAATAGLDLADIAIKSGGEVRMTGTARTRQDLLDFEKNLRDSGMFQEISSPLSNIIKENDINFILQGRLKEKFYL